MICQSVTHFGILTHKLDLDHILIPLICNATTVHNKESIRNIFDLNHA
jgi:hypothetical protein